MVLLTESPYGAMQHARYVLYALLWGGLPDGERVMFFMCDTRNLTIYNHLDQEGRRITKCPVGALS